MAPEPPAHVCVSVTEPDTLSEKPAAFEPLLHSPPDDTVPVGATTDSEYVQPVACTEPSKSINCTPASEPKPSCKPFGSRSGRGMHIVMSPPPLSVCEPMIV